MSEKRPSRILVGEFVYIEKRGARGLYTATWWRNSKHSRRALNTKNKEEAIRRARKLEADIIAETDHRKPKEVAIKEAIEKFLEHKEAEDRVKKTGVGYKGQLSRFREFFDRLGIENVRQISTDHVIQFRKERRHVYTKEVLKEKTVHNHLVLMKGFFKFCIEREWITKNPATSIRTKKPRPSKRGGPNAEQIRQILESSCDYRRVQFMTVAYSGMRSEELCRLRGEDVDLKGGWLHIVSRREGKTKSGLSRKVPLHGHLLSALQALRLDKCKLVFTSPSSKEYPDGGHKVKSKHLNEALARVLRKLGIPAGLKSDGFVIHSLRHSFEAMAVNAGIPQRVIDTWLGHHGDRSMGNVYYRLSDEESQRFIRQMPFLVPAYLVLGDKSTDRHNEIAS